MRSLYKCKLAVAIILLVNIAESATNNMNETQLAAYLSYDVLTMQKGQTIGDTRDIDSKFADLIQELENYQLVSIYRPIANIDPNLTQIQAPSGKIVTIFDRTRLVTFEFPTGTDLDQAVEDIGALEGIQFIERIPIVDFHFNPPNDEYFGNQWYLHNTGSGTATVDADIDALECWDVETGSSQRVLGIMDSGIRTTHEDLTGKASGQTGSFYHGTAVSGVAGAKADNIDGIAGVNWNAEIYSRNVSGFNPVEVYNDFINGIEQNVTVFNNSWGAPEFYSIMMRAAFISSYQSGAINVASIGNDYNQIVTNYPAAFSDVLSVGSTNWNDEVSGFSTFGSYLDVVAPGGYGGVPNSDDIYTCNNTANDAYLWTAGTSFSAPIVTGICGLILDANSLLTADDAVQIVMNSTDKVAGMGGAEWTNQYGYGRVNARTALNMTSPGYTLIHYTDNNPYEYSSSSWYSCNIPLREMDIQQAGWRVKRYEVRTQVTAATNGWYAAWGRRETTGLMKTEEANNNLHYLPEESWAGVVNTNGTTVTLRTYVYKIQRVGLNGAAYGPIEWLPGDPSEVTFEYSILFDDIPSAPTNLSVSGEVGDHPTLNWDNHVHKDVSSYNVYRRRSDIDPNFVLIASTSNYETSYEDEEITITSEIIMDPQTVFYKIKALDDRDQESYSFSNQVSVITGGHKVHKPIIKPPDGTVLTEYMISENFPNPFNPSTTIRYSVPEASLVALKIYDLRGQEIITLFDGYREPGRYNIVFDAADLSSGLYFCRMNAPGFSQVVKLSVVK